MLYTTTCTSVDDWITLKGIWNEKFGLKKTLVFERTFQVIKIGLYSCRVSHFSLEIFGLVWITPPHTSHCIMTFWEIRNIFEVVEQSHLKLCMCVYESTSTNTTNVRAIWWNNLKRYIWFLNKLLCSVTYMRWSYFHIKQIQISREWSEIRNSCKVQSL